MKQFKILFGFFIGLMFFCPLSLAVPLQYYGIENNIYENLTVHSTLVLIFKYPVTHLDYQVYFKVYNLKAEGSFGDVNCRPIEKPWGTQISCDFSGMKKGNSTVKLNFDIRNAIKRMGNNYKFEINYDVSENIDRSFILIKLPERSVLAGNITNETKPFYPLDGNTFTDGKHIMIYWEKENLKPGDKLIFSVLYEVPPGYFSYQILVTGLTIIIITTMIGIVFFLKKTPKKEKGEIIAKILMEDEKKIVDLINKHGGNVIQRTLVRESGFSKAKVSRIIKNLKERGIIEVKSLGRTNKVILRTEKE